MQKILRRKDVVQLLRQQVADAGGQSKLVEKNWNSPNSYQRGFAGTTATNNGIAQGAPVGNRLCANQESLDPRSKPGALPTQLDRHGIVGTGMI
jgi:hypothetical protein